MLRMRSVWLILLCLQVFITGSIYAVRKKTKFDNVEILGVDRHEYVRCYLKHRQNTKLASFRSCMCFSYKHNIRRKCSALVSHPYNSKKQCLNCVRYDDDNKKLNLAVSKGISFLWYSCLAIQGKNVTVDNFVLVLYLSDKVFKRLYLCTNSFGIGSLVDKNKNQSLTGKILEKIPYRHKRESENDEANDVQVTSEYTTTNTTAQAASNVRQITDTVKSTGTKLTFWTAGKTTQTTPKVVSEYSLTNSMPNDTMLTTSNLSVTTPEVTMPSTSSSTKQSQISSYSTQIINITKHSPVKTSIRSGNTVRMTTESTKNKTEQNVGRNSTEYMTKKEKKKPSVVVIVVAVLVPIIIAAIIGILVYKWYRRKYPVRMVIGKNFSKFENPMYSKKTSTLTLVRSNMSLEETGEVQNGGYENSSLNVDDRDLQPKSISAVMNERNNLSEIDEIPVKKPRRQRISVMSTESVDRNVMSAFLQEAMDEVDSESETIETDTKEKKKLSVDEKLRKNVSRISVDSENGSLGDNQMLRKKENNNLNSSNESTDNSDEEVADDYDLVEVEQDNIPIDSVRQSAETEEDDQAEPIVTLNIKLYESERDQHLDNEDLNVEIVSNTNDNIGIDEESSVSNESYTLEGNERHSSDQTDSDDNQSLDSLTNKANVQDEQTSINENLVTTSYQKLDFNSVVHKEFRGSLDTEPSSDDESMLQTKQFTNENHQVQDQSFDDSQDYVNSDDEYSRISDSEQSEHGGDSSDRDFERVEAFEIYHTEDNQNVEDIITVSDLPMNYRTDLLPTENDNSFTKESAKSNIISLMPGESENDSQSDPDAPSTPPLPSEPPPTFQNLKHTFSADDYEIINRTHDVNFESRQSSSSLESDSNHENEYILGEESPPELPSTTNTTSVLSTYLQTSTDNESGNEYEMVLNDDDLIRVSPEPDDNLLTRNSDLRDNLGIINQDEDSGKKRNEVHLHEDTSDTGSDVSSISTGSDSDENSNRGPISLQQSKRAAVADTKVIERPKINFDETDSSDEASIHESSSEDDS